MKTLDEILQDATNENWALPHFNFATIEQLNAIVSVCEEFRSPVMVGTSEGERDFIGLRQAVALVESYKEDGLPIFLNADHTKSVEEAKKAIDAGYESVHIDLSKESFEDNLAGTKEVVKYARESGRKISVEGEVGYLPTDSSKVYSKKVEIDPESLTKPEEAKNFVESTGVSRFAPAVGNLHGIAANKPNLNFELIKELRQILPKDISLVMHGGSGIDDESFKKAVKLGFANAHISTEIRQAWKEGVFSALTSMSDEYAPYKILLRAVNQMKKVVEDHINIFGSKDKY